MSVKREYRFYLLATTAAAMEMECILLEQESEGAPAPVPRELSRLWNCLADGTGERRTAQE